MNKLTSTILEDCDGESQGTSFSRVKKVNPSPLSRVSLGPKVLNGYSSNIKLIAIKSANEDDPVNDSKACQ